MKILYGFILWLKFSDTEDVIKVPGCRGGELGEPGELDGSPLFWEMICNFQICKIIIIPMVQKL